MKNLLILFLLAITTTAVCAQEQPANTTIAFEKTTIDYGTIKMGSDGTRTFTFKNIGDAPLLITNVFTSGHVKIVDKPNAAIAPGASGSIKIIYDTNVKGAIVKTITVKANIKESIIALNLKGMVVE